MTTPTPIPPIDDQDPLPEQNWFWRRSYVFALSLISLGFVWYGIEALWDLREARAIYDITKYMIGILAMLILFYMVAPSAEQIVKLIQAAKVLRAGVPVTRMTRQETPTGTVETQSTAGVPSPAPVAEIAPVAPPAAVAPVAPAVEEDVAPRSRT